MESEVQYVSISVDLKYWLFGFQWSIWEGRMCWFTVNAGPLFVNVNVRAVRALLTDGGTNGQG